MNKVSVIIPYYNRDTSVIRAIKSVLTQTYTNYEIILVNDGSDKKYYEFVENYIETIKNNVDIKHLYQNNKGPSSARNNGIKVANGEYIAFLDSDDEWIENKLEFQMNLMDEYNIDLLGCNIYIIDRNIKSKFYFTNKEFEKLTFKKLLFRHYIATPAAIMKKSVLEDLGGFPEGQRYAEDVYLFTKISRKYNVCISGQFLVKIYKPLFGASGLSENIKDTEKYMLKNFKKFRHENAEFDEKLGFILYILTISFSVIKYVRRIIKKKLINSGGSDKNEKL